ncbi:cytohesin steppke isoform X2 [Musca autumnalis]|uniref:cytohesin steppke isoform X2 n=1 Tax=Musca autumnalis TaxID=221902 RepID=UPI003CED26BC
MASLQQKRPSISNWFSSLRRQPKNKKSSNSLYDVDKQYQRSCIDLPSSTFYVNQKPFSSTAAPGTSTDNLIDNERKSRAASICTRCCCAITPKSRSHTPPLSPNTVTSSSSSSNDTSATITPDSTTPTTCSPPRSPSLNPYDSVASYKTPSTATTPTTPTSTAFKEPPSPYDNVVIPPAIPCSTYETDKRQNVEIVRLESTDSSTKSYNATYSPSSSTPCTPKSPLSQCNSPPILTHKTEFLRSTTITSTRTIMVSRPVELIISKKGELISAKAKAIEKTARSNSLGCVLDDPVEHIIPISTPTSPHCGSTPLILDSANDEFKFIDDSSTSQSENERNSQQSATTNTTSKDQENQQQFESQQDKENYYYTLPSKFKKISRESQRSMSISNGIGKSKNVKAGLYYNNNIGSLCDDCRTVIERNRNNRDMHQQPSMMLRNKQIKDELCEVVSEMEALDVPEDSKHSNKDKQMSMGRKKFNMDPKKGIEHLVEHRLLRHDPQDVAHFLYKGEGLNKTAIGDYLGENNDFNKEVLKAFVALHDFTNLILVQALRQFLWSFRLPGEAQKIDRMMECFAQRYCQLNPDIFTNTDTCYVLSFAIIMLNTSLHNPSVKDKPTVEQFISMNRGINNGGDLPRTLLESLYESIRTEPFKIPQDDGNDLMHTFFNPDKEGWLWKQGGRYKSWKRRWFILNDNCLYYFEYTTDKEPRGIIPLENICVREIHDRSKPNCFELFATGGAEIIKACKTDSEGKVVEGKHSVYRMSAATEEDQQEWIKRLTQSISHNPFYDILVQRKKKALSKS